MGEVYLPSLVRPYARTPRRDLSLYPLQLRVTQTDRVSGPERLGIDQPADHPRLVRSATWNPGSGPARPGCCTEAGYAGAAMVSAASAYIRPGT